MGSRHVEPERLFEVLDAGVEERVRDGAADVVHDDVDPAQLLLRRLREPGDGVQVGEISGHDHRAPAGGLDRGGHLVQLRLGAGRDDDVGTGLGEGDGRRGTDASPGAGHDADLAVQSEHVEDHGGTLRGGEGGSRQGQLLDAQAGDRPRDHQLLDLLGALEDVVGDTNAVRPVVVAMNRNGWSDGVPSVRHEFVQN